jgi:hypothetical protein
MTDFRVENFIGIYENAFDEDFCNRCIEYFDFCEKNSLVMNNDHHKLERDDKSLMFSTIPCEERFKEVSFDFKKWDFIGNEFYKKILSLVPHYFREYDVLNQTKSNLYDIKMKKAYPGGGFHKWHYDNSNFLASHRFLVLLIYLNDNFDGGETEFLYLGQRINPKKGTMILWPAGFTHTHRGNPPLGNSKYTIGSWVQYQDESC